MKRKINFNIKDKFNFKDFNIKKLPSNIKKNIKRYASTNILFLSYLVISVLLGLLLRAITIGFPISFRATVADLMVALALGAFGYLFKPKNQFTYFFIWILFFTVLCVGNTIYYQFYQAFLSVNLISTASMLGEVSDSVFQKLHLYQFVYLILTIVFVFIHRNLSKRKYYFEVEKTEKGKKMFIYTLASAAIIVISLLFTAASSDASRFIKQWNREFIVQKYGISTYVLNDLVQSIQPKLNTLFGYDEAAKKFREYYACKWEEPVKVNKYTNIFKGKNVLFIHAESIQNFLVDLKINGEYVTPNLNKMASEGIYFTNFFPQISVGTSSDTEFTLTTGLMPSSSGTVFVNYYDREYYGMPNYFKNMGYYTFSTHANNADYWNRKIMHAKLGYEDFFAKDSYIVPEDIESPEYIGLGLSDKSFFEQFIVKLKDINKDKSPFFGTIITLSNHSPFNAVDKYGEFDVTMKYKYIDDEGKKQTDVADYLEGTVMGNYLKSAHYADEALGEFFELLKKNKLDENTVVILYGDHESKLSKREFNKLYNYDPLTDGLLNDDDEDYFSLDNYAYDLLKNTPLIIWSGDKKFSKEVNYVMGMYDVLPTIANMFGFKAKYALGNDIFSNNEKIVVFPNGNVLTNNVYYNSLNDEYVALRDTPIESDYIERIKKYANTILDVSNGIVVHDLIKNESERVGACEKIE
jgi:phosphoglycerol transferase MdoB-like AlkP superfamily enzyme